MSHASASDITINCGAATITLKREELIQFHKNRRLATDTLVMRDIGCGLARIYTDTESFTIPMEKLRYG